MNATKSTNQPNQKVRPSLLIIILLLVTIFTSKAFSATIYIDPTNTASNQNGTIENPFNSWSKVTFTSGNTYLQKSGTTFSTTTGITISSKSGITIGAYGTGNKPKIVSSGTGNHILNISSSSNITIKDLEITSVGNWISSIIIQGTGASNNLIDNCTVYNTQWGIRVVTSSAGTRIMNSTVYKTGDDGIYAKDVSSIEIGFCKIYDINQKYFTNTDQSYSAGDGIQLASVNSMNFNIHDNHIDHSSTGNKFCIIAWGENYNGIIENNTLIGNASKVVSAIYLSPTTGTVTVRYNNIKNGSYGIYSYTKNLDAYYNNFSNNNAAIQVMSGYNLNARNNVFYNNTRSAVSSGTSTSVTLRNNIFNLSSGSKAISTQGTISSNNNLFNIEQSGFINGHSTLSSWKSASGNDGSSITGNPSFVNAVGGDFKVQSSSPAINRGAMVNLTRDFFGSPVPQSGTPDIGIHEAGGTVTVTNQSPIISGQSFNISQTSAAGTAVGTVTASDPNAGQVLTYSIEAGNTNNSFAISSSTGKITVSGTLALQTYSLTVKVTDNGSPVMSAQANVAITVTATPVTITNQAPVVSNTSFTVPQNLSVGSQAGKVTASDPDQGQALAYEIVSGNTNNTFVINASTGIITVAQPLTLGLFTLTVKVSDNGSPVKYTQGTVAINVSNATDNNAPTLAAATFTVRQNAKNGTMVGQLKASDPDAGQTVTYAIVTGNTGDAFAVNSSGVVYVKNGSVIKINTNPSFKLSVKVTDNGTPQLSFTQTITINVVTYKSEEDILVDGFKIEEPKEIRVYPNPSIDGRFSVSFGKTMESVKLEVYDITGRMVKNIEVSQASRGSIDLSPDPNGTYLIRVNTGEETKTLKAIKNN